MTRRQAIVKYYRWLHGGNLRSVRECTMHGHWLFPYRLGRIQRHDPTLTREPDPISGHDFRTDPPVQQWKAIRLTCLGCAENQARVADCKHAGCPLHGFRFGARRTSPGAVSDTETGSEGKSTTRALKPQNLAL